MVDIFCHVFCCRFVPRLQNRDDLLHIEILICQITTLLFKVTCTTDQAELDGYIVLRTIRMCFWICVILAIPGILVVLPLNKICTSTQIKIICPLIDTPCPRICEQWLTNNSAAVRESLLCVAVLSREIDQSSYQYLLLYSAHCVGFVCPRVLSWPTGRSGKAQERLLVRGPRLQRLHPQRIAPALDASDRHHFLIFRGDVDLYACVVLCDRFCAGMCMQSLARVSCCIYLLAYGDDLNAVENKIE